MTVRPETSEAAAAGAGFPIDAVRAQFPALGESGNFVFFDNGGGAQVPQAVLDAVHRHLIDHNVQRGGRYAKSKDVDNAIAQARSNVGKFVNARRPEEIAFGMNATSFIRLVSLAIGQALGDRNEFVVTDLDHEANIATWLALKPQGARFRWWKVRPNGILDVDDLRPLLSSRTRLVACALASNALGSIVDVRAAAELAHRAGAEIFLDAVHYAPHGRIDVRDFNCDYLVCSGYKIFAPHMGFLWGRYELLQQLRTFREDFIPDEPPGKIEAGTVVYENVAGMDAAISYLSTVGHHFMQQSVSGREPTRNALAAAMDAIRAYERLLTVELINVLKNCGARIYGHSETATIAARVPTVSFNLEGILPSTVTEHMAQAGIGIRDGHLYSPRLMNRLALDPGAGAVRVSLVHYNTMAEIHRFGNALLGLKKRRHQ